MVRDYDSEDWWWRCSPAAPTAGRYVLRLGGLATIADVWWNGSHLLHSANMFVAHEVEVDVREGTNDLQIRCAALAPMLAQRRPRPRWRSPDLVHQNLRWIRTSLLGRQVGGVQSPAPVGPWRPVSLTPQPRVSVTCDGIQVTCAGEGGTVTVDLTIRGVDVTSACEVRIGEHAAPISLTPGDGGVHGHGHLTLERVERWWPHTHGTQPLYSVDVVIDGQVHHLRRIGFRTVEIDRTDGGFTLHLNGKPTFARGSCWSPLDQVSLQDHGRLRERLELARRGNHNIVRITGTGTYVPQEFLDLCDELGLLIWQDCMFAFFDAPCTDEFVADLRPELVQLFGQLQGRPSVAVVCGSSDSEEQAAYLGLPPDRWVAEVARTTIPTLLEQLLPGTPYVRSSPSESPLPSIVNRGPSHYYGVGAYFQPTTDARRAGVRFASECLCLATPAEPLDTLEGTLATRRLSHHPQWKSLIHRDAQSSWDLEDVRDWYTRHLFDLDPLELRRTDGSYAATVARATSATLFEEVLAEWRRPGSSCAGAIVFESHDSGFGVGIGIVDSLGRPKAPWYVMRRLMQPVVVTLSNEGVNGLGLHICSDDPVAWKGKVRLDLFLDGEQVGDSVSREVEVNTPGLTLDTSTLFGGFRDLSFTHRFGPAAYDVIAASLTGPDDQLVNRAVYLPNGRLRPAEPDLGLSATVFNDASGWVMDVATRRFAQWVTVEVDGWLPSDSWFHLLPGESRHITLGSPTGGDRRPSGDIRALNCQRPTRIEVRS